MELAEGGEAEIESKRKLQCTYQFVGFRGLLNTFVISFSTEIENCGTRGDGNKMFKMVVQALYMWVSKSLNLFSILF